MHVYKCINREIYVYMNECMHMFINNTGWAGDVFVNELGPEYEVENDRHSDAICNISIDTYLLIFNI